MPTWLIILFAWVAAFTAIVIGVLFYASRELERRDKEREFAAARENARQRYRAQAAARRRKLQ